MKAAADAISRPYVLDNAVTLTLTVCVVLENNQSLDNYDGIRMDGELLSSDYDRSSRRTRWLVYTFRAYVTKFVSSAYVVWENAFTGFF